MLGKGFPFRYPFECLVIEVDEILRSDELKRLGMRIRKGLEQNHPLRTGRKGKVFKGNRLPLRLKLCLGHLRSQSVLLFA